MDQVIVTIAGHQYQVKQGDVIDVPYQADWPEGKEVKLDQVVATLSDNDITPGTPYLDNVVVKAKVIKHFSGPKVSQINYKAKSRYRRRVGWRAKYTRLNITQITTKAKSAAKSK